MENIPVMLLIKRTYRRWTMYMKKICGELGIPESYRMILTVLQRHPGASQKDLAKHCDITASSVNQTVNEMTLLRYIDKADGERDKRYTELFLTEKGVDIAKKIKIKITEADKKIALFLGSEKEDMLKSILKEVGEFVEEELSKC